MSPADAQRRHLWGGHLGAVGSSGARVPGRGHSSAAPRGMGVVMTEGRGEALWGFGVLLPGAGAGGGSEQE